MKSLRLTNSSDLIGRRMNDLIFISQNFWKTWERNARWDKCQQRCRFPRNSTNFSKNAKYIILTLNYLAKNRHHQILETLLIFSWNPSSVSTTLLREIDCRSAQRFPLENHNKLLQIWFCFSKTFFRPAKICYLTNYWRFFTPMDSINNLEVNFVSFEIENDSNKLWISAFK